METATMTAILTSVGEVFTQAISCKITMHGLYIKLKINNQKKDIEYQ